MRSHALRMLLVCLTLSGAPLHSALPDGEHEDASDLSRAERHNNLGTQHAARGDYRQAAAAFRKAVELDPTMTVAHFNLGLALARVNNHEDAVFAFQSTLRLAPRYFDGWFQLGLSLMAMDRYAEAATAFEECLSLRPQDPAARFRLGQSYWKAEKWPLVIAQWDSLLNESPGHPSTEIVRAQLPSAHYNIGLLHHQAGETARAREAYEEVLRLDARYVSALNNLAILVRSEGKAERAVDLFERVTEIEPEHTGARIGAAEALLELGRPEDAMTHYEALRKLDPTDERAYRGLALCHVKMGETDEALARARELEEQTDPYRAAMLKAFILEHNRAGERYGEGYPREEAMAVYRSAIEAFPDRPSAHYNLGVIHARSGMWADAVAAFDRTLAVDSTFTQARTALEAVDQITKQKKTQILRVK